MSENDSLENVEVKKLENPMEQQVEVDSPLKDFIVNYVGQTLKPENNMVTLEMIVQVVAQQFPEFVLGVAEENFLRGYNQALSDLEAMQKQKETTDAVVEQVP